MRHVFLNFYSDSQRLLSKTWPQNMTDKIVCETCLNEYLMITKMHMTLTDSSIIRPSLDSTLSHSNTNTLFSTLLFSTLPFVMPSLPPHVKYSSLDSWMQSL